jgi:hypothetical protein
MLAAPISACACSHHEEQVKEVPSCHGHAGEAPASAADVETISDCLSESCVCVVRQPVTAVGADKKTSKADKSINDPQVNKPEYELAEVKALSSPLVRYEQPSYKSARSRGLLPSRAPPRL